MRGSWLLLGVAACAPGSVELSLEAPAGMRSAVTTLEIDGRLALVSAIDLSDPERPLGLPVITRAEGDEIVLSAAFFESHLAALHVDPGPIELLPGVSGEPLPPFDAAGQRRARGATIEAWVILTALPEALASVRLPGIGEVECLEQGGCLVIDAPSRCAMPCPSLSAIAAPAPPVPPAPVAWSPCPDGWSVLAGVAGAPDTCAPWPDGRAPSCGPNELVLPGGCAPIDAGCPSGDFADPPAAGSAIYVRPAAAGGDGSAAAPFGRVEQALAVAAPGASILLSKGRHDLTVDLRIDLPTRLIGACAEGTILAGEPALLWIGSSSASIERLRLEARISVEAGASLEIAHTRVVSGHAFALNASQSQLILHDVDLSGVAPLIALEPGAIASLTRGVVHDTTGIEAALHVRGATLGIERSTLINFEGWGADVIEGGRLEANGLAITGARERALYVVREGSSATLRDLWIDATRPGAPARPDEYGRAVLADSGGRVRIERARIARSFGEAIRANEGSTVELTDVLIEDTRTSTSFMPGSRVAAIHAITTRPGIPMGLVDLERVFVRGGLSNGIYDQGSKVRGRDLTVVGADAPCDDDTRCSRGIYVFFGAIELERVEIRDVGHHGLRLANATATIADARITGVRETAIPGAENNNGIGILLYYMESARLSRIHLEDVQEIGLHLQNGHAIAEDLTVRNLTATDDSSGAAIEAFLGGHLTLARAAIERVRYAGLAVNGNNEAASLRATDVTISETDFACTGGCGDFDRAAGVVANCHGELELERFSIASSAINGVHVRPFGVVRLTDGRIEDQQIGVLVEMEAPPALSSMLDRVRIDGSTRRPIEYATPIPGGLEPCR